MGTQSSREAVRGRGAANNSAAASGDAHPIFGKDMPASFAHAFRFICNFYRDKVAVQYKAPPKKTIVPKRKSFRVCSHTASSSLDFESDQPWSTITYHELEERVRQCAAGLRNLGIERGDRIALLSEFGWEWICMYFAAMYIGAAVVVKEPGLSVEQIVSFAARSESSVVVTPTQQVEAVEGAIKFWVSCYGSAQNKKEDAPRFQPHVLDASLTDLIMDLGHQKSNTNSGTTVDGITASTDDVALLCSTSGATADPKLAIHTQGALMQAGLYISNKFHFIDDSDANKNKSRRRRRRSNSNSDSAPSSSSSSSSSSSARSLFKLMRVNSSGGDDDHDSSDDLVDEDNEVQQDSAVIPSNAGYIGLAGCFLPAAMFSGLRIVVCRYEMLRDVCEEIKPSILMLQPWLLTRAWQEIMSSLRIKLAPRSQQKIQEARLQAIGDDGVVNTTKLNKTVNVQDSLISPTVRALFGGRCKAIFVIGAKCDSELLKFFWGMNVPIYEGYVSTETLFVSFNHPNACKLGTAGTVAPGVQIKIADDGEVLVRGNMLFKGYYNSPDQTEEVVDQDGWYHTGDIGEMVEEGKYLSITGRKKEMITLGQRHHVYPATLEDIFKRCPLVQDIFLVGDGREYLVALVFPRSDDTVVNDTSSSTRASGKSLNERIMAGIAECGRDAGIQEWEYPEKILIISEGLEETGCLTGTFKLRRDYIVNRFQREIEWLYNSG